MRKQIYKYALSDLQASLLLLPAGAEVLSVGVQSNRIVLWALVDADVDPLVARRTERKFEVFCTGEIMPPAHRKFIGTVFIGEFVYHIFEWLPSLQSPSQG